MIDDQRKSRHQPRGFVVATDSFLSGWGEAPGRSLYAIAVESEDEAYTVMHNMKKQGSFKRIRWTRTLPRIRRGDHLSVRDRHSAPRYFMKDGFDRDRSRSRRRPKAHRDAPRTRDYEYIVYREARMSGEGIKVRRGRHAFDLSEAKRVAKRLGAPAAIYSVTKGRFVGYIHHNGRFVSFR